MVNNLSNVEKLLVMLIGAVGIFVIAAETGYLPQPNTNLTEIPLPQKEAPKNQPKVNRVNSQLQKKASEPVSANESKSVQKTTDTVNFNSRFIKEVTAHKYQSVATPPKAPVFRWDFSGAGIVHTYEYEQETRSINNMGPSMGGKSNGVNQEVSAKGMLLVESRGDGTAELMLKSIKMSMKVDMGGGEPKTREQQMPPVVVQGMQEDSSGPFGNSTQDIFLKMLFPLPTKELKVGESVDVPMQIPFNAMGSLLQVTGHSRITLSRYVKEGNHTYAQLNVDTDVSELKVPKELKGEYKSSTKGKAVFYFDVENRSFVSGAIAMLVEVSIDAPMPKMDIPGMDNSKMPKRTRMAMASDNLIRVKLKR